MKLAGKTLVVTGAASGIGRALAEALLSRRARVAAVDLRRDSLDQLERELGVGARLSTHAADVSDREVIAALPEAVARAHGAVDGLINNAGIIQPFVPVAELDLDTIDRVMRVNFMGQMYMIKAFLPALLERPEAHITNISSMGGFFPFPGQTIYGASKAAVKLMSEGLAAELADTSVGVSVIMPGGVETHIAENSGIERPRLSSGGYRLTTPEQAAATICNAIEARRLHVLVGTDARLMFAASRLAPETAARLVRKPMKKLYSK